MKKNTTIRAYKTTILSLFIIIYGFYTINSALIPEMWAQFGSNSLVYQSVIFERAILFFVPAICLAYKIFPRQNKAAIALITFITCIEVSNRNLINIHLHELAEDALIFPWFLYEGPLREVNNQYTYVFIVLICWLYFGYLSLGKKQKKMLDIFSFGYLTTSIGTVTIFHIVFLHVGLMVSLEQFDESRLKTIKTHTETEICPDNMICFSGNRNEMISFLKSQNFYSKLIEKMAFDARNTYVDSGVLNRNVLAGNATGAAYKLTKNTDRYHVVLDNSKLQTIVNIYTHINTLLIFASHTLWSTIFFYAIYRHRKIKLYRS